MFYVPTPILADISHLPPIQIQDGQSLLHQAWRSVMTSDPLLDSDEENGNDDELRTDYAHRLTLISNIRGRPPTPDNHPHIVPSNFQPPRNRSSTTFGRLQRVETWD